ncbi:MAG: cell division protein ZapA [Lachnospiraceae bacterium]|nr:cell division protein ZapA [Lachnospiraceae bacterium]
MDNKRNVEVIIGGKVYTVSGYEEEAYLHKVAAYINGKVLELQSQSGFSKQSSDMQNALIQLNIADDYFKKMREVEDLSAKLREQDKELYSLKHELVSLKMRAGQSDTNN